MPATITKSLRLSPREAREIKRISQAESIVEANFLKKLLLEGLAKYRLQKSVEAYTRGVVSLREAARMANLGYSEFFEEIRHQRISLLDLGVDVTAEVVELAKMFGDDRLERAANEHLSARRPAF